MTSIVPPFTLQTAIAKVRAAEDAWNSRDPHRVSMAYSTDSQWRNREVFLAGRDAIREFLSLKWQRERDYRLAKSLWSFTDHRIAVRFQYEYQTPEGQWHRAYGNELWEFDAAGLMVRREASINDASTPIAVASIGPHQGPDPSMIQGSLQSSESLELPEAHLVPSLASRVLAPNV